MSVKFGLEYDGVYIDMVAGHLQGLLGLRDQYPIGNGRMNTSIPLISISIDTAVNPPQDIPSTRSTISSPMSSAAVIGEALDRAQRGLSEVWLIEAAENETARRRVVYSGEILGLDSEQFPFDHRRGHAKYALSIEHELEAETKEASLVVGMEANGGTIGIKGITGHRPGRIAQCMIEAYAHPSDDSQDHTLDHVWIGMREGVASAEFSPIIDCINAYTAQGNTTDRPDVSVIEHSAAENASVIKIDFQDVQTMTTRFEFMLKDWNELAQVYPTAYRGKYRLITKWATGDINSEFIIKWQAGYDGNFIDLPEVVLKPERINEFHYIEAGTFQVPSGIPPDHFKLRLSATRIESNGSLFLDRCKVVPQEHSLYMGATDMRLSGNDGGSERIGYTETDAYGNFYAYAESVTNQATFVPDAEPINWTMPKDGIIALVADTAAGMPVSSWDGCKLTFDYRPRFGVHAGAAYNATGEQQG